VPVITENPWTKLASRPPYVLPEDEAVIKRYPSNRATLRLDVLPVPYIGDPVRAEVVLLALNPGFVEQDALDMEDADFAAQKRAALTFTARTPFKALDPTSPASGDYLYWHRALRPLIERLGQEVVAEHLACVEFFPYASIRFKRLPVPVPSQFFGFRLVRDAVDAGKLIVILRGEDLWTLVAPSLNPRRYMTVRNKRVSAISPKNMDPEHFEQIVARLGAAS
jgi:hypothetical protein